jgi:type I restriction enzyme, S subunit
MMDISKISARQMTERLDAEFYKPIFLTNKKFLQNLGICVSLDQALDTLQLGYTGPTEKYYADSGALFLSSKNLVDGFVEVTKGTDFISLDAHYNDLKNTQVKSGDLLYSRTGTVGKSAVLFDYDYKYNIAAHLIAFRINKGYDSYFLSAFFNSSFGRLQSKRLQRGTIIQGISIYDIPEMLIPKISKASQKYIGNKIHQAEILRDFAKHLEVELKNLETNIPVQKPSDEVKRHSRVGIEKLSSNRLNAEYYKNIYLNIELQLQSEDFVLLDSCCAGFKYGASVAADYVEIDGITFIRGNNLAPNRLDETDVVSINSSLFNDLEGCFVKENDILITRSGTVGVCCVVPEFFDGAAYGSFIIKFQSNEGWEPEYIAWFINSWIGQSQVRRLENGAVQLNINTQELSSIKIWQSSFEFQRKIKLLVEKKDTLLIFSNKLCDSSKKLIESLIEGKISEAELIQTQQTLEKGDNTLDRQILGRLKSDGIDGGGDPLFNDLDQLYEAIEQVIDQKNEV